MGPDARTSVSQLILHRVFEASVPKKRFLMRLFFLFVSLRCLHLRNNKDKETTEKLCGGILKDSHITVGTTGSLLECIEDMN